MSGDDEKKKKVSDWNEAGYYGSVFASDRVQVGNKTPKFDYNHIEKPTTPELKKLRDSYIKAAKLVYQAVYNDRKGSIRGDLKPLDQMSDNELVAFAKSEMGWFSQNTVGLTKWFARLKSGNMTQDQKQAFGYLMEIHDHTATDLEDIGNFLYKGLIADPTTYVGLGTLGAGTVAAQGAKQLAKKGVTQIIKASLKKQVVKELGGLTLKQATKRQIIGAAMKASAKQTLTGTMIRGTKIGIQKYGLQRGLGKGLGIGLKSSLRNGSLAVAVEGAITSWYMDDRLQKSRVFAGVQDEYNASQNNWSIAMGVGMGEIFTFGAGFLGRGTTGLYGKYFDDPPSTLITRFAKQLKDGVGTGLQRLDNAYQGSSLQRWSRSQMGVLSMNPFGAAGGTRPRPRGGVVGGGATTSTGLELPAYNRKIDWMKVWLRRTSNPFTFFTKFAPLSNMDMECRPLVRPVFQTIDKIIGDISPSAAVRSRADIADTSLIKKLQELERQILDDVDAGGANVRNLIDDFGSDNATILARMHADLVTLRKHVDDNFTTLEELNKDHSTNLYLNAIYSGAHHKTGITANKKKVLLAAIDEYINITSELQRGSAGRYGREMLDTVSRIQSGVFTTQDVRESGTRLSRANYLIDHSETGLTGNWARSDSPVNRQWSEKRVRGVQDEYHNPEHYEKPIALKDIKSENLEKNWQNQILKRFEKIGQKDDKGNITSVEWTYPAQVVSFEGLLTEAYYGGYGNEVQFMIRQLGRWRQKPGQAEIMTMPSSSNMLKAFEANSAYKTDPKYKRWADNIVESIKREEINAMGAAETAWWIGPFEHNRPNKHYYQSKRYPFEFSERWSGTGNMAKPGRMYWRKRLLQYPFKSAWTWLLGAKTSKLEVDAQHGDLAVNVVWRDKEGKESWFSIPRRILVRWASLGLLSDLKPIGFVPIKPEFTKLGKYAAIGGGIWAVGAGTEYAFGENGFSSFVSGTGETVARAATYYQREGYDVILGDDDDYNILPWLDEDAEETDESEKTIEGPEGGTGAVVPPDASTRTTENAGTTTTQQPEKKKAPPPIHGNQDAGDYFKIKTKGRSSKKSSGSDWDFFNNYAAGSSGGNGGGSGPKGALERTGTGLMNFGGFLKDNILDPVVGGVKGLYKNNPDGFGFLMAIVTAFVSGNFIFKGSGILGTVLTGVFAYFAFNMAKGSAGGFGQGNGDHVPRMVGADQNYRRIGNVRLPSDINTVRMTSHSGSTSSLYINDNVEGLTVTDDEETGSGGDSRGLSKTSTAATFTSVANDVQPIDPQQAALLSAMTGEGEGGGLVSGFTAVQGGGRYGDINAARDFSGAANFTAYDNQGDDGFVPQEMRSDDPFAYMDVADSHEVNAKVVTFNLAQEEFSGPPSLPHGPVAGQNVRMGMNT